MTPRINNYTIGDPHNDQSHHRKSRYTNRSLELLEYHAFIDQHIALFKKFRRLTFEIYYKLIIIMNLINVEWRWYYFYYSNS